MLPQIIKSAVSSCVVKALCKKANSRKQIRAFLVKLAADKLQNAYKFAPRGSTTQHMSPVPGAKGREQLLRPSMTKVSFSAASSPKLPGAPAAPKAPAALKAPSSVSDTAYDLKNVAKSPGTNLFNTQNPNYAAMRSPDPARLAPKPQMRPGMSNQINYGTGPSGNPVIADIVPGGTMPVGRPVGPTAAEREYDAAAKAKFQAFRDRGNPTVSLGPRTLKQRQAAMNKSPTPAVATELAPVPIPEPAQTPPVSTPLPEAQAPESLLMPSAVPQRPAQLMDSQTVPDVSTAMQSPYSQMLDQSQSVAPKSVSNMIPPNLSGLDPRALFGLLGRQAGQQTAKPSNLYDLFAKMRGGLGGGIQNLAGLFSQQPDDFQL